MESALGLAPGSRFENMAGIFLIVYTEKVANFFNVHIMNVNHAKFQKKFDSRTISRELP